MSQSRLIRENARLAAQLEELKREVLELRSSREASLSAATAVTRTLATLQERMREISARYEMLLDAEHRKHCDGCVEHASAHHEGSYFQWAPN